VEVFIAVGTKRRVMRVRAVIMTATGGPGVLKLTEVPEPEAPSGHGVRVRLRAAGVNPVDGKLRAGGTIGGSLPAILGWDGAGIVEETGPAVSRVRPGDEVYFCNGGFGPTPGTYQELMIVDERYLARKPERLSFVEAAAAPLVTITAWEAQQERARVHADQFVLVQAGAGGVGHMSVQIARLAGAHVATTVTPGPKTALASSLGAELCIDYTREDVGERLRAWTGMDGADVVHDTVGGKTFTACFSLVRPYGDLVSNVESPWEDAAIAAMHDRNLRVSFTWMPAPSVFGWPAERERQRAILEQAAAHFGAGDLRVQVGATFRLAQAADAHRAVESGQVIGKTVLTMD
jgi:NADPH2:quinone reductase